MSFTEWYENLCGEEWHEDYALLGSSYDLIELYQEYCDHNNIKPIWNG